MKDRSTIEGDGPGPTGARAFRGVKVPAEMVAAIDSVKTQRAGCLITRIGISENTWRKVRGGQPIRQSVYDRLVVRLAQSRASDGKNCSK